MNTVNLTNVPYHERYRWQSYVVDRFGNVCYTGKGATREERRQDALDEAAAYPPMLRAEVVTILPLTGERD